MSAAKHVGLSTSVALLLSLAGGCASDGGDRAGGDRSASSGRLVAIADGDMLTSAFRDGTLFESGAAREQDTLTVVALPLPEPEAGGAAAVAQAPVSNSVLGPPRFLAITPDGMSALVLASRGDAGDPPYDTKTMGALSREGALTLVDISGAPDSAPVIIATMPAGVGAKSVAVHPAGDLAAVVRSSKNAHDVLLVRIDARHGMWKLAEIPLTDITPSDSVAPACIAFSPNGHTLAITAIGLDQVFFYEVMHEGGVIGLKQWGAPVGVANFPYAAEFTPDGRHLIVSSLGWGDNVKHDIESNQPGTLTAVRVAQPEDLDPRHELGSTAAVGVGPEGLAISPDGALIVTGNMRLSHLAPGDSRATPGSLTLLTLDERSGALVKHGEYDCPPAPQGLAFDDAGRTLYVADYNNGVVQEWRVLGSSRLPTLEYTRLRVGIARGVHALAVTR